MDKIVWNDMGGGGQEFVFVKWVRKARMDEACGAREVVREARKVVREKRERGWCARSARAEGAKHRIIPD